MSQNEKILLLRKILTDYLRQEKQSQEDLNKTLNQFAIKIQQQYRSKQQLDRSQKAISDYLCNKTANKREYRQELFRLLQANNTPHKLQNQYFYYCKFGKDSLGIDKKDKIVPTLIKEINNCLFLNTSFASTNFDGIKFKLTKFFDIKSIVSSQIYQNLMKRSESLRSIKTDYKKSDSFKFDNANLINCFFEECLFHGIKFSNIKHGVSDLQIHKHLCPMFLKCKYDNCVVLLPEENKTQDLMREGSPYYRQEYRKLYPDFPDIPKKYEIDHIFDVYYKSQTSLSYIVTRSKAIPLMIYENCYFKSTNFRKLNPGGPPIDINRYLFINCTFINVYFTKIVIETTQFVNCKFTHGYFNQCKFNKMHFKDCQFENFEFKFCELGNTGNTEFTNTKFKMTNFISCILQNYFNPLKTCIIHDDCQFDLCTFNRVSIVGFNFNFDWYVNTNISYNKMLQLTKCQFIGCEHVGTNYSYCNLEGSKFISPPNYVNYFSWFGNILLSSGFANRNPTGGENKTKEFQELCGGKGDVCYSNFLEAQYKLKVRNSRLLHILKIDHNEWLTIGNGTIDPYKLSDTFKPYDYIELPTHLYGKEDTNNVKFLQFLPATSMVNTNIKACNFQSTDGFQGFNFTQIYKTSGGNPDLTATNFTDVDLTNANLTNAKLTGTVFQVANINGTNFLGTQPNENTDFENTLNIGLAVNAEHIQFGDLQERANETHARAKFIVNNRNKLKKFYTDVLKGNFDLSLFDILKDEYGEIFHESSIDFFRMIHNMTVAISMNTHIDLERKNSLVKMFPLTLAKIIAKRLNYNEDEEAKLLENLNQCFTSTVIDIMFTYQEPRQDGGSDAQDRWTWLSMVYQSIIFLLTRKKLYLQNFITYYFDEVFNAHGQGSPSCPLGYVERWVTIHSQTAETYLMLLKVDSQDEIKKEYINSISEYDKTKKDEEITIDYMEIFNNFKESQEVNPETKYLFNRLINLIKPHSNLSENASEEVKEFSFDITPAMREEWQKRCSKEIIDGKITTLNQVLVHFVENIRKILLESYSITDVDIKFYSERDDLPAKKFNEKIKKFTEFLKTEEVERLQQDMIMMCDLTKIEEITLENLKYYVEGGSKRSKPRSLTLKKGKTRSYSRSRSLSKLKTIRARSFSRSKQQQQLNKLLESIMLKQFVNLSKEKFETIFCKKFVFDKEDSFRVEKHDTYDTTVPDLRGMNISDKSYRLAVKRRHNRIKNHKLIDPTKIYSFDKELERKTKKSTKKSTKKLTTKKDKPSRNRSHRIIRRRSKIANKTSIM